MPSFKLTYFAIEGVAEKVRLAFKLGAIPFEDERIAFPEWEKLKPTTPNDTLPILTIDGSTIVTQSASMLRYIGGLADLVPSNLDHVRLVDEIIGVADDVGRSLQPSMYIMMRPETLGQEDRSEDARKEIQARLRAGLVKPDGPLRKLLGSLDRLLCSNSTGSGFCVGSRPTIADCEVLPLLRRFRTGILSGIPTTIVDEFPALAKFEKTFSSVPAIRAHYGAAADVPELIYFNGPGRARVTRLAMTAGGVKFTDTRHEFEGGAWPAVKADPNSAPAQLFGSMPVIKQGDFLLAQSQATAVYAAELGLYRDESILGSGVTAEKRRAVDLMALGAHMDLQNAEYKCIFGTEESKKAGAAALPAAAKVILDGLERVLGRAGPGPYLYSSKPSLGDLAIYDLATSPFPNLASYGVDVAQWPRVQALTDAIKADGRFASIF